MKMSTIIFFVQCVGVVYLIGEVFPFRETPMVYGLACLAFVFVATLHDAVKMSERE
jgi:hypothetical protein